MSRRTLFSLLIALITIVFASTGRTSTALAQCCNVTVDVNCNLPAACFPITVKTNWQQGAINNSQVDVVFGCGANVFPITAVPCPPQPGFNVYSLNGGAAIPVGAPPTQVFLVGGGCCVWTWGSKIPGTGCPIIYIVPC